jgi:hypothetical protein
MNPKQFARSISLPHRGLKQAPRRLAHSQPSQRPKPLVFPKRFQSVLPFLLACSNLQLPRGPWGFQKKSLVFTRKSNRTLANREIIVSFFLDDMVPFPNPVGFLRPEVADGLLRDDQAQSNAEGGSPWNISRSRGQAVSVSFSPSINKQGRSAREAVMKRLLDGWREDGSFRDILSGAYVRRHILLLVLFYVPVLTTAAQAGATSCIPSITGHQPKSIRVPLILLLLPSSGQLCLCSVFLITDP